MGMKHMASGREGCRQHCRPSLNIEANNHLSAKMIDPERTFLDHLAPAQYELVRAESGLPTHRKKTCWHSVSGALPSPSEKSAFVGVVVRNTDRVPFDLQSTVTCVSPLLDLQKPIPNKPDRGNRIRTRAVRANQDRPCPNVWGYL